jgi:hypothetical protein
LFFIPSRIIASFPYNDVKKHDKMNSFLPSVEQLRVKSGKTMVGLSVAGHSRFLQKRKGQVCSDSGVKIWQPRFCLICSVMALCGKEAFLLT